MTKTLLQSVFVFCFLFQSIASQLPLRNGAKELNEITGEESKTSIKLELPPYEKEDKMMKYRSGQFENPLTISDSLGSLSSSNRDVRSPGGADSLAQATNIRNNYNSITPSNYPSQYSSYGYGPSSFGRYGFPTGPNPGPMPASSYAPYSYARQQPYNTPRYDSQAYGSHFMPGHRCIAWAPEVSSDPIVVRDSGARAPSFAAYPDYSSPRYESGSRSSYDRTARQPGPLFGTRNYSSNNRYY